MIIIGKNDLKCAGKLFLISCFFCFSLLETSLLRAETREKQKGNEVLAIGTGAIISGNLAQAKKKAISQALMKGMESYLLYRLGSQGVVNNFPRLIREIVPRAKEVIENFHILTEDRVSNKCKVLVQLRINEKIIDKRLKEAGVVLAEGPPIKVLFLVSEIKEGEAFCWWKDPASNASLSLTEIALYNIFQSRGLIPINRIENLPEAEYYKDLMSFYLLDADILAWGRLLSADVVIYGQSELIDDKNISLTLKALDVEQGVQIYQGMQVEQPVEGLDDKEKIIEAHERLVNNLAGKLVPATIRFFASNYEKIQRVEVTLKGLNTFKQFRVFKDFLIRDVTGVKSVMQTRVRRDSMSIAVEFQGDRNRFLDRVINNENLPFPLDVYLTEEGEIVFRIG